ncbi:Aste57867_12504 [Aphanomyces stellatus]|uniref:Aste57867_12504 protein n=1 Tax=Aphanomyces stellatus TaxID=120398 RepID=A0A485KWD7_9STRA|nr:hypothetical protein As57867_012458 [Aphanomyces stellatus]VFT89355.1 Aste57867_12504 [Aphanomyces stellatus]
MLSQLSRSVRRATGVRSLSTSAPYVIPEFPSLLEDIERDAAKNKFIKVSKLTNLFKQVTTKEQLDTATQVFKVYERKFIDPTENTAGEFLKACLKHDAGDVALTAFANNFRVGLFVTAGPLNKLLAHFHAKNDDASIVATFDETNKYDIKLNATTYRYVINALLRSGDADKALELINTAASKKSLAVDTCNEAITLLVEAGAHDKVSDVVAAMTSNGIEANDATKALADAAAAATAAVEEATIEEPSAEVETDEAKDKPSA